LAAKSASFVLSWILVWPNRPKTREKFWPFAFAAKSTDWLAVHAVLREPVSGSFFAITGKNTGKNRKNSLMGPPAHAIALYLWAFRRFSILFPNTK